MGSKIVVTFLGKVAKKVTGLAGHQGLLPFRRSVQKMSQAKTPENRHFGQKRREKAQ